MCLTRAQAHRLKNTKITHIVEVLLLGIAFHTEYPVRVRDAVNISMFPDLSLAAGMEADLVVWRWDTVLDSNTITSYANIAALMMKHRILPIFGWKGASNILEQWIVLIGVILVPP